ncbi:MAG: two-component system, OmpR family, response regulator [Actinomycetota bacterium]|nr:two-component system, OmpR family, response regulator [Actinomycetota bacterium]
MPPSQRVLVVDDEANIAELVATALRYEGFDVTTASTGTQALEAVITSRPDLVVLDVMLPDLDGFEVARRLGEQGKAVPILFLTARDSTDDKIRGLTIGGDDYVTKPFSLSELLARVHAVLRRGQGHGASSSRLVHGDLEMDDDTKEVVRGSRPIELTATEYRLLRYLLANGGKVLTRAQLLDHVWDYDFGGDSGVLETYISYLRKKVDVEAPPLIHTVRGVGYSLRSPRR